MLKKPTGPRLVPFGLTLALAFAGCGGNGDDDDDATGSPTPTDATPTAPPGGDSFESALTGGSSAGGDGAPSEGDDSEGDGGGGSDERTVEEGDIFLHDAPNHRLYILNAYRGLQIVDISDPDRPSMRGRVPLTGYPIEMYLRNGRVYVVVSNYFTYWYAYDVAESPVDSFHGSALAVVDVDDPDAPSILSRIDLEGYVSQTRAVGDGTNEVIYAVGVRYAYYSCSGTTDDDTDLTYVTSIDVTDPRTPHVVDQLGWPGYAGTMYVSPRALYLLETEYVYPDETGPTEEEGGGGGTAPGGESAEGAGTTGDPEPTPAGTPKEPDEGDTTSAPDSTPTPGTSYYATNITYVDISDVHGAMVERDSIQVRGYTYDDDAEDERDGVLRIVTQDYDGVSSGIVSTIDISDPDDLKVLGTMPLIQDVAGYLMATRFYDTWAVVAINYGTADLTLVDLSDPAHPRQAGSVSYEGSLYHLEALADRVIAFGQTYDSSCEATDGSETDTGSDGEADPTRKPGEDEPAPDPTKYPEECYDYTYGVSVNLFDVSDLDKPAQLDEAQVGLGDYAWSSALWDDKAFAILPEEGLIAMPFTAYEAVDKEGYYYYSMIGGVQLMDYSPDDLTTRGIVTHPGYVSRVRAIEDRLASLSDSRLLMIDASDRDAPKVTAETILARNVVDFVPIGEHGVQLALPSWEESTTSGSVRIVNDPDEMNDALSSVDISLNDGQLVPISDTRIGLVTTVYDSVDYVYRSELRVYDVSDPAKPVETAALDLQGPVWSWATDYSYYWGSGGGALVRSGDVLAYLEVIYEYDETPSEDAPPSGSGGSSGSSGSTSGSGKTAAGTTYLSRVHVIDLSDPDAPTASVVELDQALFGLRAIGSTLYATHAVSIGDNKAKYYADLIDITDPAAPVLTASINVPGTVLSAIKNGSVLVTLDYQWTVTEDGYSTITYSLRTVRLENGRAYALDSEPLPGYAYSVAVNGNAAYVVVQNYYYYGYGGEDTAEPGAGAKSTDDAYYGCYYGELAELRTVDLTDPADLATSNSQELPITYGYVRALEQGRLFIDGSYQGLLAYDIASTPLEPKYDDFVYTSGWAYHVRVDGDRVYLPAGMYGVSVWDLE